MKVVVWCLFIQYGFLCKLFFIHNILANQDYTSEINHSIYFSQTNTNKLKVTVFVMFLLYSYILLCHR